jgi:hypothetical protein
MDPQEVPIEQIRQGTDKKGNADQAGHNGVEEHAHLKIERLLAIVIHKLMLFLIGGPQNQGKYEIPKGNKIL